MGVNKAKSVVDTYRRFDTPHHYSYIHAVLDNVLEALAEPEDDHHGIVVGYNFKKQDTIEIPVKVAREWFECVIDGEWCPRDHKEFLLMKEIDVALKAKDGKDE